ncbi:MAG: hypothetical protein JXM70_11270, partial [Pirellulales bacterium]|nr:hypothetical protein [Pirellulales bacterium]
MKAIILFPISVILSVTLLAASRADEIPLTSPAPPADQTPAAVLSVSAPPTTNSPTAESPPAVEANSETPEGPIRFQFDGIPYMEVVERFAQMVKKPLVTDLQVEGTLTFHDAQPYHYQEALDTLNLILSMKDVMLVETKHYLRLISYKKLPQMPLKIIRGTDQTGDVRPGEVVTFVLRLQNLDPGEVTQSVTAMLSSAGSMAPLTRGRGLIITDRLENIQRIRELVTHLDVATSTDQQMKTLTLMHASGAVVTDLINRTFGEATAPKRMVYSEKTKRHETMPPDPNDYVTAVWDEASRTLVLYGPVERIALAEELVKRFEEKEGAGAGEVKIFYPRNLEAEELGRMIRQAMPGVSGPYEGYGREGGREGRESRESSRDPTRARLIVDSTYNRLIVTAPVAGQMRAIEELIERMDGETGAGQSPGITAENVLLTKVFSIKTADPANIAKVITDALSRRSPTGRSLPSVKITVDQASRRVIVIGTPGELQLAESIVSQIDGTGTLPSTVQMRLIELHNRTADELSPLVERLYSDQLKNLALPAAQRATIVPEAKMNRFLVSGIESEIARVEAIVRQLDPAEAKPAKEETRVIRLQHAIASDLATLVEQSLGQQKTPIRILVDRRSNSLVVTGRSEAAETAAEIIQALDTKPEMPLQEMRFIDLTTSDPNTVVNIVREVYTEVLRNQSGADRISRAKLIPDSLGNRIIVCGSRDEIELITKLIEQVDKSDGNSPGRLRVFKLKNIQARDLVRIIYESMSRRDPRRYSRSGVAVDDRNNCLIVSGTPTDFQEVEALIEQLDQAATTATRRLEIIDVGEADEVQRLVPLVQQLYREEYRDKEASDPANAQIIGDPDTGRILVTASPEHFQAIETIVQRLRSAEPKRSTVETRVYDLENAYAGELAYSVQTLYRSQPRRRSAAADQVLVLGDRATNRLLVSGPAEELEVLDTIIKQLDRVSLHTSTTRIFRLKTMDPGQMAAVLSSAFSGSRSSRYYGPRLSIGSDSKSNVLILSGDTTDLEAAAKIIEQLDTPSREPRQLRIFPCKTPYASEFARKVRELYLDQLKGATDQGAPDAIIQGDDPSSRLIVAASESQMKLIENILKQLDEGTEAIDRQVRVLTLKHNSASSVAPMITQLFAHYQWRAPAKYIVVTAGPDDRTLVVEAAVAMHEKIEEMVKMLDVESSRAGFQVKTYRLTKGNANELAPSLSRLFAERYYNRRGGTAENRMPPRFEADSSANALIVAATDEQFPQIQKLIDELQATVEVTMEIRTFTLQYADVEQTASILENMLSDSSRGGSRYGYSSYRYYGSSRSNRDFRVSIAPTVNALVIQATPEKLEQAEDLLKSLDKPQGDALSSIRLVQLTK